MVARDPTMHDSQPWVGVWRAHLGLDISVCPHVLAAGKHVRLAAALRQHVRLLVHKINVCVSPL